MTDLNKRQLAPLALATLTLAISMGCAQAATRIELNTLSVKQLDETYRAAIRGAGQAATTTEQHAELLGLSSDSSLSILRTTDDANGFAYGLWRTDGTAAGTVLIRPGFAFNLTAFGDHLYFTAGSAGCLASPWASVCAIRPRTCAMHFVQFPHATMRPSLIPKGRANCCAT